MKIDTVNIYHCEYGKTCRNIMAIIVTMIDAHQGPNLNRFLKISEYHCMICYLKIFLNSLYVFSIVAGFHVSHCWS